MSSKQPLLHPGLMGQFVPASKDLRCVGLGILRGNEGKLFGIVVAISDFPLDTNYSIKEAKSDYGAPEKPQHTSYRHWITF